MPVGTQRIAFGEYMPDLPNIVNTGLSVAQNTVTDAAGYGGMKSFAATPGLSALDSRPRGGFAITDSAGNPYSFVGTESKLYRHTVNTDDVSRTGAAYSALGNARWEFAVFGDVVIAVNPNDETQYYTLGPSTKFDRLGNGTTFAPRAKHVGIVGSFLMLGNTFDPVHGGAENAIHWSAVADPFNWPETGSSVAVGVQSDRQVLEGAGGAVQAVVTGSEVGAIFQERAIWRADFVGGDVVFRLSRVDPHQGLLVPGLAIPVGRQVFYLSETGFYMFDYTSSTPIGRDRVDKTFLADLDRNYLHRVSAVSDPDHQRIWISYPGQGNVGGLPNKLLVYDWGLNRWSHGEQDLSLLVTTLGRAVSLDYPVAGDPGIDSDPDVVDDDAYGSFDDRVSAYGARSLGAYDSNWAVGSFDGPDMPATLETGRRELSPGGRSLVTLARPLVDTVDPTIQVAGVSRATAETEFGEERRTNQFGECSLRQDGRYHVFRINLFGGFENAVGIDVNFQRSAAR